MTLRRVLVVRTDRLGDFVLSIPVLRSLRAALPEAEIGALAAEANAELAGAVAGVDRVHAWRRKGEKRLLAELRAARYDAALVLFNRTSVNRLLARAGIPLRAGPATKLARLWLTRAVRQRRAEGRKHEMDHNLDLLAALGVPALADGYGPAPIRVPEAARARAEALLAERGLAARPFAVLHPGTGGSALPWRTARFAELGDRLEEAGVGVLVTGGPGEEALVEKTRARAATKPASYIGRDGLLVLAAILARAGAVVAASTGPLHLASALGTPVVGLYCPRFACAPGRWGPRGTRTTVLAPPVGIVCDLCLGPTCPHYDCMDKIAPARALAETLRWVRAA